MISDEIKDWLARYLRQEISFEQLEDWFLPATWSLRLPEPAYELAAEIRLTLAEFDRHDISEEDLRGRLTELAGPHSWLMAAPRTVITRSRNETDETNINITMPLELIPV